MPFLEVSTTIGCALRCSYCPQDAIGSAYSGPRLLSFDTFAASLAHCPPGLRVSFAGFAEPYLNRDCTKMVRHAAAAGHPIQMYTTGIGMDDADVEALSRVNPSPFVLHLPDGDGDMKARVTEDYTRRMSRLATEAAGCQVVCYGRWHAMLEHLRDRVAPHGLHSRAGNVTHLAQVSRRGPLRCRPAPELDENVLLPDGRIVACCNDWRMEHVLGNLSQQTWQEIHEGPAISAMRQKMKSGEACLCQSCEFATSA